MQTKTKQIIIIIVLGLALVAVGFLGFTQTRSGDFIDDDLGTQLVSDSTQLRDKQANKNTTNTTNTTVNNSIKINSNEKGSEEKIGFKKKETVPVPVPEIIREKTVIKLTDSIPKQQIRYDKNSVVEENGYLRCLKDEHILQWSAGDNEWDCVRPGESVFGKVVATKRHGVRETSTGVVYCAEENNLLVWENNSWRCKAYNAGGTDNQTLAFNTANNFLSISNGNSVDLSSLAVDSDILRDLHCANGQIAKWNNSTNQWECAVDSGGVGSNTFIGLTDTPNNYGTNGYLVQTDGVGGLSYINPNIYLDNTDDQRIDNFSLAGNVLSLEIENDGQPAQTVNLAGYLDNTDSQTLSFNSPNLSISGGNSVDLSALDTDTTYSAGNGLSLSGSNVFSVNSPTCSGTDKLQWNGTAFVCSADVDTDTTYSAGTGLALSGTNVFSLNSGINNLTDVDTVTSAPSNGEVLKWDGTNWVPGTDSGGATTFTGLSDTPNNYTGSGGYLTRVNAGETALEFVDGDTLYHKQNGNSYGALSVVGTNDNYGLALETNNTTRATFDTSGNLNTTVNIVPTTDDTYTLGTSALRWRHLYVGPNSLHIGSTNTDEGIIHYDTNNNILNFETDSTTNGDIAFNTDDLFIDKSSGNIGIGVAVPNEKLQVRGGINLGMSSNSNAGTIRWSGTDFEGYDGTVWKSFTTSGGGADNDWTINGNYMYSTPSGNVGIGTSSPSYKLQVDGDVVPATHNDSNLGASSIRWQDLYIAPTSDSGGGSSGGVATGIHLGDNSSNESIIKYYAGDSSLLFKNVDSNKAFVFTDSSQYSVLLVDTNNRFIGINNDVPQFDLDVSGNGRFTSTLRIGSYTLPSTDGTANQVLQTDGSGNVSWATVGGGGATAFTGLSDTPNNYTGSGGYLTRVNAGETALEFVDGDTLYHKQNGNSYGALSVVGTNDNYGLALETNNTTRATFDTSGNLNTTVNIVPTTDDTYTLGTSALRWRHLYVGPNSLHIGTDGNEGFLSYDTADSSMLFDINGDNDPEIKFDTAGRISQLNTGGSVIIGEDAGLGDDLTGNGHIFIGQSAGIDNTGGFYNVAIGPESMGGNTGGDSNIALGQRALYSKSTNSGSGNIAIGVGALSSQNAIGDANIVIGLFSGTNDVTGSSNILIGSGIDAPVAGDSNQLSIGNLIFGIGLDGTGSTISSGNIGIGTNSPDYKLQVDGDIVPESDNHYDLGKDSLRWRNLYLGPVTSGGGNSIHMGTSTDETIFEYGDTSGKLTFKNTQSAIEGVQFLTPGDNIIVNIDTQNSRLAIKNHYPQFDLDVSGTGRFTDTLRIGSYTLPNTDGTPNQVLQTDGSGTVSWATVGGGGATAFTGLSDTPNNYTGSGGYLTRVNAGETALEFVDGDTLYHKQNGNSYGALSVVGTNDNYGLALETNNTTRATFDTSGNLNTTVNIVPTTDDTYTLGTSALRWRHLYVGPNSLHIGTDGNEGVISYDTTNDVFSFDKAAVFGNTTNNITGTIRWNGTDFEGYDGTTWRSLTANGGSGTPSGASGAIQFNNSGAFGADGSNLFWDDANDRLGVGTNTPGGVLHVITQKTYTDLTQGGTASASSVAGANTAAENAFDDDAVNYGWGNNNTMPSWLKYDFGAGNGKIITQYTLYRSSTQVGSWNNNNYSPKDWTFEGSNDNSNWTVLDTQANQQILMDASKTTYSFSNTTSYRYYRINISAATSGNWVNITEMEMMEASPTVSDDDTLFVNAGNIGIGTTTPSAQLHTTGTVRFANFGAGTLQTDANGNVSVSSDERLKNIQGDFNRGLNEILSINPIEYKWKKETGYDTENSYYGFSAQNVQASIPEAVGLDKRGYLTLSDRPILATAINAIKELHQQQEVQNIAIQSNTLKTDTNIQTLAQLQSSIDKNLNIINQTLVTVSSEQELMNSNISKNTENIEANTEALATLSENIESLTELTTNLTDTVTDHERRIAQMENIFNQVTNYNNQDANNQNNPQIPSLNNLTEALQNFSDNLLLLQEGVVCDDDETECIPTQPVFSLSGDLIVERLKAKKIEVEEIEVAGVSIKSNIDKDENGKEVDNSNLGKVVIPAGKKSVVVKNGIVKKDSYIMLTPNQPVAVGTTKIISKKSFEVSLDEILDKDLVVNWFILKKGK